MDFLNKAFAQFNDLFRSMTPGGRITAGLLLVVAVVSVGYLFQHQVTGGDDYLFGGESIPPTTSQKMEGAFGKAGLNGFVIDAAGRVKVPHSQRDKYLAALVEAKALPPNLGENLGEGEDNIFWSPKQREEHRRRVKEERMSLVIGAMKDIERASVIIDEQERSGFESTPLKTASITVWGKAGAALTDEQIDMIKYYVKNANAGMKPEDVAIADATSGTVYAGDADKGGPGGDNPYNRAQRVAERDLDEKIHKALSKIPNVTVTSNVTLDHEKGSHSEEIKTDPKPVPVRTLENTRNTTRDAASSGGAPGVQAQGGGANQAATLGANAGRGSNETSEESKNETVSVVSSTSTVKDTFGLTPKLAKVSIGIPASYYEKVWRDRNPVKEGEDAKKPDPAAIEQIHDEVTKFVQATVANLLPIGPDVKDPTSLVNVTTFPDIKTADPPAPAVTLLALRWLEENWPMMAMVGLVVFSLVALRSMLRNVSATTPESAAVSMRVSGSEPNPQESEEEVEVAAARRLRRMTGSGPTLRDELSELVKEDPDSAANVLRSWIGQVT